MRLIIFGSEAPPAPAFAEQLKASILDGSKPPVGRNWVALGERPAPSVRLRDLAASPSLSAGFATLLQPQNDELKRLCGPWNRPGHAFVDAFLAYLTSALERERSAIEERLAPFHGLYRPEDVLFSAPLPLPQAQIEITGHHHQPEVNQRYAQCDFCFVLSSGVVALLPKGSHSRRSQRKQMSALEDSGATIVEWEPAALVDPPKLFRDVLGSEAIGFLHEAALPRGPGPDRASVRRSFALVRKL